MNEYFWAPRVHAIYSQLSAIFLMRPKYPFLVGIDDVEKLVQSACIPSYRIYSVYGPNDIVVVAQAHDQKLDSFYRLSEEDNRFSAITRFDGVQYFPHWRHHARPINDSLVEKYCRGSAEDADLTINKMLANEGLKIRIPQRGNFRFFTHFRLPPIPTDESRFTIESQYILNIFCETVDFHECVYIKKVDGKPREFIVETLCEDYSAYYDALSNQKETWIKEKVTFVTHVVSSPRSCELDLIDVDWTNLGPHELRMLRFLQHRDAFQCYSKSSETVKSVLKDFYKKYNSLDNPVLGTPFEATLRDLLRALLMQDRDDLLRALTLTVKLEGYFHLVLRQVWMEIYGNAWYNKVSGVCSEFGIAKGKGANSNGNVVNSLTLAVAIEVANKLPDSKVRLNELFGSEWYDNLKSITDERNHFAHGRAATASDALETERWTVTAGKICGIANFYNKVVQHYESHR